MDYLWEAPVRDHLRGVVSALDLRAVEDPVGTDVGPSVVGFREVDILSRPRSRSDPIGESEPVSGCETICWDSFFFFFFSFFFFFKAELISVVYK